MNRLLRAVLGTLVVLAFLAGPAIATPHMLGMDCSADCPECVAECCCGPAIAILVPVGASGSAIAPTVDPVPLWAAPAITADPLFPGTPPRGPPA